MKRMLLVAALFAAVGRAASAVAQPPGGFKKKGPPAAEQNELKDLEALVQKLRAQLEDVETQLKKLKGAAEKDAERPFGPPGGFGGFKGKGFPFGKKDAEKSKDEKSPPEKEEGKKQFGKKGVGAPAGAPDKSEASGVEERLDRLIRELEALRRDLKQK
jgi:hypothetical protein